MSAIVELARFQTRVEADLARLRLEADGIQTILFDAETSGIGWRPIMPVRLMVRDTDRWQASCVLE